MPSPIEENDEEEEDDDQEPYQQNDSHGHQRRLEWLPPL